MNTLKHLSGVINISHPRKVLEEVGAILCEISPNIDLKLIETAFNDTICLFKGEYVGYLACNTKYHNQHHTLGALLALVRLIHGAANQGNIFSDHNLVLSVICTLFHDSGYMQSSGDLEGTGAKYTITHIQRSIDFLSYYMKEKFYPEADIINAANILNCTGLNTKIADLKFADTQIEMLGKILGTADLLGQMSDRYYLEKLIYLYQEFIEGGITIYSSERDLLQKRTGFVLMTEDRCDTELGGVWHYMQSHYHICFGYDYDPYKIALQKNLDYLKFITEEGRDYTKLLRRGNIVHSAGRH